MIPHRYLPPKEKMNALRPSAHRALRAPGVQASQLPPSQQLYRLVPVEMDSATGLARVNPGETLVALLPGSTPAPSPGALGLPAALAGPAPRSAFELVTASVPQLAHADPWLAVGRPPALAEQACHASTHTAFLGLPDGRGRTAAAGAGPQLDLAAVMRARHGALAAARGITMPHASSIRVPEGAVEQCTGLEEPARRAAELAVLSALIPSVNCRTVALGGVPLTQGGSTLLSREVTTCLDGQEERD